MSATADLLKLGIEPVAPRKSASHGEAGYERKERDFYPTEPWVTRALLKAVDFRREAYDRDWNIRGSMIWEPACGDGRMAEPLREAGYQVVASDIGDYGYGNIRFDFLEPETALLIADRGPLAAIVTNPPFDLAVPFIIRALELTKATQGKVAILQRHEFDAPASNRPLFQLPFAAKLILHKRPRWSDGPDKASPRFPYAWYLWDWAHQGPPILRWLPDPDKSAPASGALL